MTWPPLWLKSITPFLLVAILSTAGWTAFLGLRGALLWPCQVSCTTLSDYMTYNPFCVIDPTCISPLYEATKSGSQDWVGLQAPQLSLGQHLPPGTRALALPNYILFMLVAMFVAVVIVKKSSSSRTRRLGLAALLFWCTCEIAWWFIRAASADPVLDTALVAEACAVYVVSISILGLTVRRASMSQPSR